MKTWGPRTWLILLFTGGIGLRLVLASTVFVPSLDSSVPGLMALRILDGERPLFFYGQSYMGSIEAYGAALAFKLFGVGELQLTFSPIFFSMLWIGCTYLLFRDLFNRTAGVLVSGFLLFPPWPVLWYTTVPYGGYPEALFFGTLALWICVRLCRADSRRPGTWGLVAVLGAAAGLGLWTHFFAADYLLIGLFLLPVFFHRNRWHWTAFAPFILGAVLLVGALWPVLAAAENIQQGPVAAFNFSRGYLQQTLAVLLHETIPEYFVFPTGPGNFLRDAAVVFFWVGMAVSFTFFIRDLYRGKAGARTWLPLALCVLSVLFYLPHQLAITKSSRYLIPEATMLGAWMLSVMAGPGRGGGRRRRLAAVVFLAVCMVYNTVFSAAYAVTGRADARAVLEDRSRLADTAVEQGIRTAALVGGESFQHLGSAFTFAARDRVRFVSIYEERYFPSSQALDEAPDRALAFRSYDADRVRQALDTLSADYTITGLPVMSLAHEIHVPHIPDRAVPAEEMRCHDAWGARELRAVRDRVYETSVSGLPDTEGLLVDLGRERTVSRAWLMAEGRFKISLPAALHIEGSLDGKNYFEIQQGLHGYGIQYAKGPQVYIGGYQGVFEARFPPVQARWIRLVPVTCQRKVQRWKVAEVFLFETVEDESVIASEEDVHAMFSTLHASGIDFAFADRWISALFNRWREEGEPGPEAFLRLNRRYPASMVSRELETGPGRAVIVENALAEETRSHLRSWYGPGIASKEMAFPGYTAFILSDGETAPGSGGQPFWNGHTLLLSTAREIPVF